MASLNRILRTSRIEGKCWQQELNAFLRAYRNTPHCSTQKTPAELLLHRSIRMTLPAISDISENEHDGSKELYLTDSNAKRKMKNYADQRRHAKPNNLQVGDYVLVKSPRKDKLSSYYDPVPYIVTNIKGTMISAHRDGHNITRNASFFKRIVQPQFSSKSRQMRSAVENPLEMSDDDDVVPQQQQHSKVPAVYQQNERPMVVPARNIASNPYPQRQIRRQPSRLNDFVVGSIDHV